MTRQKAVVLAAAGAAICGSQALAQVTITQGNSAPTYATTLNFDEPGGPVSNPIFTNVPSNSWQASHGIVIISQDGLLSIGDHSAATGNPWLPTDNTAKAGFGINLEFDQAVTEFSMQHWDNSGPGGPFGGGFRIDVFDGANQVGSLFGVPAWGSNDNSWINIVADPGTSFDSMSIPGFGFAPQVFADNLSWNAVPAPGSVGLLALGGLVATRRRRA